MKHLSFIEDKYLRVLVRDKELYQVMIQLNQLVFFNLYFTTFIFRAVYLATFGIGDEGLDWLLHLRLNLKIRIVTLYIYPEYHTCPDFRSLLYIAVLNT